MKKQPFYLVILLSLVLIILFITLKGEEGTTFPEALKAEGIPFQETAAGSDTSFNGKTPKVYKIGLQEEVRVYQYESKEQREKGYKAYYQSQMVRSSYPPLVFESDNYLVLYYSRTLSPTVPIPVSDTRYGKQISKAVEQMTE
jgi:hypothetical protein